MTARSIRRAAERKRQKLARKSQSTATAAVVAHDDTSPALPGATPAPEFDSTGGIRWLDPETAASVRVSAAQLRANRANAEHSTGPTSPAGKATSSLNACKTGLTGRTVLLPSDDVDEYRRHVQTFLDRFQPAGDAEAEIVQTLAETRWRLNRIPVLEFSTWALGRLEASELFAAEEPEVRKQLIDAHVFRTNFKQFNNLQIQEARLHRLYEKQLAELHRLHEIRALRERLTGRSTGSTPLEPIAPPAASHVPAESLAAAPNGFEFSNHPARAAVAHPLPFAAAVESQPAAQTPSALL